MSTETISRFIGNLPSKSTASEDGISTILLKEIKSVISEPLRLIVNQSITTGKFPDKLKVARVKPLFKKDDIHDVNNFRPISVLPSISKFFEKALLIQMNAHFLDCNLFHRGQYGFREKHSTELATLELIDRITNDIDQGKIPLSVFLDLSKAFDSLNHSILLNKLRHYGINGIALELCKDYLSNRQQFVQHENVKSNATTLDIGVPQGSVLGPFFFLVYINDFNNCSKYFKMINYADDTTLLTSMTVSSSLSSNPIQDSAINSELSKIHNWLLANKLCLNVKKTKFMVFHSSRRHITLPKLQINGSSIDCVDTFNYLGIYIDKHLNWNAHISHVKRKIGHVSCILNKLKHFLPAHILKTIYNSLITCHFNYGLLIWGNKAHNLLKILKNAVRIITSSNFNAHTEPLLKQLGLLKISDIKTLNIMKFYYKFLNGQLPEYFHNGYIVLNQEFHQYNTRNRSHISTPRVHFELSKSTLRYQIISTINECPNLIKSKFNTHSLKGIATYIKNYLLSQYSQECLVNNCRICSRG